MYIYLLNNYHNLLRLKKYFYKTNRLKPIRIHLNNQLHNKKNYLIHYKQLFYINYFNKLLLWNFFNFIHILNVSEFLIFYRHFKKNYNTYKYVNVFKYNFINYIINAYKYYYYIYIININKLIL